MSRTDRFLVDSVVPHVLGGFVGGLSTGVVAAAVSASVHATQTIGAMAVGAAVLAIIGFGAAEATGHRIWRPNATRQVSRDFQRTRYHRTTAFLWGLDLGFGWTTKQPTAAFLVAHLAVVLVSPTYALIAGAVFGTARALTLALAAGSRERAVVEARFDWLLRHPRVARLGTSATAFTLASVVAYSAI